MDIDEPVFESDFAILSDAEALCTESGSVFELPNAVSAFDLNRHRAEALATARAGTPATAEVNRGLINASAFNNIAPPSAHIASKEGSKQSWYLEPEEGVFLPLDIYLPEGDVMSVSLVLSVEGRIILSPEHIASAKDGQALCAVDLRGYGETTTSDMRWGTTVGGDWCDFARAFLLGRSYVGMRSDDIGSTVQFLRTQFGADTTFTLEAFSGATVPALHAAALNPEVFSQVTLVGGIPSWSAIAGDPYAKHQLVNAVHGALRTYDLPDLIGMMPAGKIIITDPVIPHFEVK